jgi:hypothetical protein
MDLSTSGLNLGANFGEHMTELEKRNAECEPSAPLLDDASLKTPFLVREWLNNKNHCHGMI